MFTCSGKVQKGEECQYTMIKKQQVKNEYIKRKQTCSLCFVNVLKFQEKKIKIAQKNFWEIKITLIKENISLKSHLSEWSLDDDYGWSKAEDWQ